MSTGFSRRDHLFNEQTLGGLADEYAAAWPEFDRAAFLAKVVPGLAERALLARLDWIADCVEPWLPKPFDQMADALEAAMPPPLNPDLRDDDFGYFVHAVPGILAVRHGLEAHRTRALDLLYHATKRFSMEFYIRPFLNRWPEDTLTRLHKWAEDPNYHVRRLVSEGTRPRLPWAQGVDLQTEQRLPLLDKLHADHTRYVTRSVANHLNDIAKTEPGVVLGRLQHWQNQARQTPKELDWMTRHALRVLVKQGHVGALKVLGFDPAAEVSVELELSPAKITAGQAIEIDLRLHARTRTPVLVDYAIDFVKAGGKRAPKVFKLRQGVIAKGTPLVLRKTHRFKADASTFRLYPGEHRCVVLVNGVARAEATFVLDLS